MGSIRASQGGGRKAPSCDGFPLVQSTIQEMVKTDARNRIRLLSHGVCQGPNEGNEVHNKRRMKGLVVHASRGRLASVFAGGIWPSHGWDDRKAGTPMPIASSV